MVTETYPPEVNGVARTVQLFAEGLCRRGHRIQLVRPSQGVEDRARECEGFSELLRPGIAVPRYPQLRFGVPSTATLARAWRDGRPDVVHVATEGPLGWTALSAAIRLGIPTATDFHTNFHAYSRHYGFAWMRRPVEAWLRRFHNRAGCTIVPTGELAGELTRLGFERMRVVGRGVDASTFAPAKRSRELRARWGAGEDTPVALCVSRFAPEKNFPLVIEAYRAMRAARPDTKLVLVGDGPMLEELRAMLSGGLGCLIAGRLVNGELSAHYASADIFLFPSVTETFGNVTLEAMASGLAVVAHDYAAARQVIGHRRSGLLSPPGDDAAFIRQAVSLAQDLEGARAMGREAHAVAERLSWDGVVGDFERVLAQSVAEAAAPGEAAHAAP
jgi:glycosyltransferase involved in cell wall biosynthesis